MSNSNLTKAKKVKNDEFYTQYVDIEKELQYYNIEGKTIYCNCDNPAYSNFYKYFKDNFHIHKIKQLYCTGYNSNGNGYYAEYDGNNEVIRTLNGDGDFRSKECTKILQKVDTIITNPPFSMFKGYVKLLMDYNKQFLIIGNQNAITYKEIFPYIKNNELWLGCRTLGIDFFFNVPEDYKDELMATKTQGGGWKIIDGEIMGRVANACWFTNIPHINPNKTLILTKTYNPENYPQYDNYDAINVDKVKNIPIDYDGVMGVPITFLQYYNPSQFEIIKFRKGDDDKDLSYNGNTPYFRILIKKNDSLEPIEFEIIWTTDRGGDNMLDDIKLPHTRYDAPVVNGKGMYKRIFIKKNDSLEPVEFEIVGGYNYSKDNNGNTWNAKINGKYIFKRLLIKRKQ